MFWSLEDARSRLDNTLMRTKKGHPIVIMNVDLDRKKSYRVTITYLSNQATEKISLEDIDLSPVPLGNINKINNAYFVTRQSARMWKQGLSNDNLNYWTYGPSEDRITIADKALIAPIANKYPSVFMCYKNILKGSKHQAFSRMFSIYNRSDIIYKCREKIGTFNEKWLKTEHDFLPPKFELNKDFFYFKELLEESLNDPH